MTRKIEKEIELAAAPEEVWRALTEAEQLRRWFPLDARVKPGAGGSLWLSWGEGSDWEAPIEVWEPSKHLRTVDRSPAQDGKEPLRLAVDYILEGKGGSTRLRLVHSGFADDTWEGEIESTELGWASFLRTLKLYLERHRGEERGLAFFRHPPVALSREEAFRRTLALLGFDARSPLVVGEAYDVTTRSGDRLQGRLEVAGPPINCSGVLQNWDDGFLMVEIEGGRERRCRPAVWISLYGAAGAKAPALGARLRALLEQEFRSQ